MDEEASWRATHKFDLVCSMVAQPNKEMFLTLPSRATDQVWKSQ